MSPPKVDIPKTNYTKQLTQTLKGQELTAPGYLKLNQQYADPYTDLNLNTLRRTLFGSDKAPGELGTQAEAQTFTRGADISDIERFGRRGYDALMTSNPGLARTLGAANTEGAGVFATGSLMTNLEGTANRELMLGGSLSPEEQNAVTQGTRSGFADRGMVGGNQALGAELLSRDAAMQARLGQRLGWGQGVEGLAGQDRTQLNQLAQLNAGVYDPSQQVIARGGTSLGGLLGGGAVGPGALMGTVNTGALFNPNAGADAFNTGYNAQAAQAISNANSKAGFNSSLISGGAAIAGSLITVL